jgi:hypothetical protein
MVGASSVHQAIGLNVTDGYAGPKSNRIREDGSICVALYAGRQVNRYAARKEGAAAGSPCSNIPAENRRAAGLQANTVLRVEDEVADSRRSIEGTRSGLNWGLGCFIASACKAENCRGQGKANRLAGAVAFCCHGAHAVSLRFGPVTVTGADDREVIMDAAGRQPETLDDVVLGLT